MRERGGLRGIRAIGMVFLLGIGLAVAGEPGIAFAGVNLRQGFRAVAAYVENRDEDVSPSLDDAETEKESLEEELAEAEQAIKELKESQGDLEAGVAELNRKLVRISARVTELELDLAGKGEEIVEAAAELAAAKEQKEQQYEDMKVRIRFMYENRRDSFLGVLLSSDSLIGFLNAREYISQIQDYDRQKLAEYTAAVGEIADMEEGLLADYEELESRKAEVETEKAAVAALMQEGEQALSELSGEIEDAQDEADYYAAELQAQEELIAAIKRAEAEKAAAGAVSQPYAGGAFAWPCPDSTRVTSDYGLRAAPVSGASSNHMGIDIGADYGADIVAAAAGTVAEAGYSSAGGNYVMLDHGGGLYTIYMHASSLSVSTGQAVDAGQVIAKVGSTGISTGNHLHFGVSLGGSYVNPWEYLGG